MMSLLSRPPLGVKNFSPLRLKGRWLAVTMTEAVAFTASLIVVINMAGVEARPQSTTLAPASVAPFTKALLMLLPERRQSVPTAIVGASSPEVFLSQQTNALPIVSTTSCVRFTCSPSMPSRATPLMSEPFCNFIQFIVSIFLICDATKLYIIS